MDKNKSLSEYFRRAFIDDLPVRLAALEKRILEIGHFGSSRGEFGDIFLELHSIKGSSSTFGLQILSSICHPFEDLVQEASTKDRVDAGFVELALEYVNLLAETTKLIDAGEDNFRVTELKLVHLHDRAFRRQFSIAVAVNSRMLRDMCRETGKTYGARVVEFDDSLNALQRLLAEPFHVVIVSSELYPIPGESLVAAMKLSHRYAEGLKTLLITSHKEKVGHTHRDIDPDFIVLRDKAFLENLQSILSGIHEHHLKMEKAS